MSWRSIGKDRGSFLINLLGLSSGLTCAILILLWTRDELKVDTFHENDKHLYEVMVNFRDINDIVTTEATPDVLGPAMVAELPEVEAFTYTNNHWSEPEGIFTADDQVVSATGLFAHDNFFQVLTYSLIEGSPEDVLNGQNNVVLSESLATRLFGSPSASVGQSVRWNFEFNANTNEEILNVSGVYTDPPSNATMTFDAVVPYDILIKADQWTTGWNTGSARTFVVLKPGTDIAQFNHKIAKFHHSKDEDLSSEELFVQQFSSRYLFGNYENGMITGGRIAYVRFFSLLALIIILIGCINFVNLTTAQASKKMKEIGVKKTMGARRMDLAYQFFSESTLITFGSFIISVFFVNLLIPRFNRITGKELHFFLDSSILFPLLGMLIITSLLAGAYPAFYLSGLKPQSVLQGRWISSSGEKLIRKGLVVFQFAISALFVIGILVVQKQIEFTQKKNLGYDREHIICFKMGNNDVDPKLLVESLQNIPGVVSAGHASTSILKRDNRSGGYSWTGREKEDNVDFLSPRVGINAIETFGIQVIEGRSFQENDDEGQLKVIINESARSLMKLENPIGFKLGMPPHQREIIGVVKDFQYGSLHDPMQPLILRFRRWGRDIIVRIQGGTEEQTIPAIQELFSQLHPGYPFDYTFMDDDYAALYQSEQKVEVLSKCFGILAILISCMGLLGLSTYMIETRSKEIGIRKVLGASIFDVVRLLTSQFTSTVIIGICLAIPTGYYLMNRWLTDFAYHIDLHWSYFAIPAILVLLVAWSVVSVQTFKSAIANPSNILRDE